MGYFEEAGRPAIPAGIRRSVLVEAGHRCAIPTCRYIEVDIHHIIPWAKCEKHEYENLIALCPNCHRRADRDEIDRKSLRLYKANLRFAHDKFSQLELDVLFELFKLPEDQGILWPPFNQIMLKRTAESGYINIQIPQNQRAIVGGMDMTPVIVILTPKGRAFLHELGDVEL